MKNIKSIGFVTVSLVSLYSMYLSWRWFWNEFGLNGVLGIVLLVILQYIIWRNS